VGIPVQNRRKPRVGRDTVMNPIPYMVDAPKIVGRVKPSHIGPRSKNIQLHLPSTLMPRPSVCWLCRKRPHPQNVTGTQTAEHGKYQGSVSVQGQLSIIPSKKNNGKVRVTMRKPTGPLQVTLYRPAVVVDHTNGIARGA